jgi:uracil-DNA glycosylase
MGFCYPGTSKGADLPPRPECAPLWHEPLLSALPNIELYLLFGRYAHARYLGDRARKKLTDTVANWRSFTPRLIPMPHPSPRNQRWLVRNPWFEDEVIPYMQRRLRRLGLR